MLLLLAVALPNLIGGKTDNLLWVTSLSSGFLSRMPGGGNSRLWGTTALFY
jgi:hypothetical protein